MRRIYHFNLVFVKFFFFAILNINLMNVAVADDTVLNNEETVNLLMQCTREESALTRLECYDNILRPNMMPSTNNGTQQRSSIWHWIVEQEDRRTENTTELIIDTFDDGERVLLTTPAIGHQPPRPILAFSCIDNITRMQIVLFNPMNYKNTKVQLVTDNDVINANWFVRENGFIFESSRGLLGIEQIKRILSAQSLTLKSDEPMLNGLVFNLTTLDTAIKPLRTACHW